MAEKQSGYVLLFVLGLLAVMSTLLLNIMTSARTDVQMQINEQQGQQQELLLKGASQYLAMQLTITATVDGLKLAATDPSLQNWKLWRADGTVKEVTLDNQRMLIELENVSGLPDANQLSPQEWERLFQATGTVHAAQARELSQKLMAVREQFQLVGAAGGFSSMQQLLDWSELPASLRLPPLTKNGWGLQQLVVLGTRNRTLDLNTSPLPLMQVMANVTDEQLQQLATLRRLGPLTAAAAQQWTMGSGLIVHAPNALPVAFRARIRFAARPTGRALIATLSNASGDFSVVDLMFERNIATP